MRNAFAALTTITVDDLLAARVVPAVDLLDSLVLVLTARHVVAGTERRLGGDLDPTGSTPRSSTELPEREAGREVGRADQFHVRDGVLAARRDR
ncbi:MAG: hypothetical protein R2710_17075 [Acidimicrobiales bacterium]